MVNLTLQNKTDFEINAKTVEKTIFEALEKLGQSSNIEIELIFVNEKEILELNSQYRQIDKATDVLSFPQAQFETEANILGSIVICPEVASERNEPILELVKHGLLHLLGYDHDENEEKWDQAAKKINCNY